MVFFCSLHADVWINSLSKEMEEMNSAEEDSEDSVFLSADEDVCQDLCSAGSRGQPDKERSKRQGGGNKIRRHNNNNRRWSRS